MSDELKSAWELALEKLAGKEEDSVRKLSDDQKQEIAELRRTYKARVAEKEIALQARIRESVAKGDFDKTKALQRELVGERKQLEIELEERVEQVRARTE